MANFARVKKRTEQSDDWQSQKKGCILEQRSGGGQTFEKKMITFDGGTKKQAKAALSKSKSEAT